MSDGVGPTTWWYVREIAKSIAVIVALIGLFLTIFQIKQGRLQAQATLLFDIYQEESELRYKLFTSTDEDQIRAAIYDLISIYEAKFTIHEMGLIDDTQWASDLSEMRATFEEENVLKAYEHANQSISEPFKKYVGSCILEDNEYVDC